MVQSKMRSNRIRNEKMRNESGDFQKSYVNKESESDYNEIIDE